MMQYIVMDLEWNNVYSIKRGGFMNEVIEIGAVRLDEQLCEIDAFSHLIKSQIGKRLRGHVRELTHLTNEDLQSGEPFTQTMAQFRKWVGNGPVTVLTWGDTDIRVLIENFKLLNGLETLPFLTYYADLQKNCSSRASAIHRAADGPKRRSGNVGHRGRWAFAPPSAG